MPAVHASTPARTHTHTHTHTHTQGDRPGDKVQVDMVCHGGVGAGSSHPLLPPLARLADVIRRQTQKDGVGTASHTQTLTQVLQSK